MSDKEKLTTLYKFISAICIEAGCGYDIKKITADIVDGYSDYSKAIEEWLSLGHCLL